MAMDKLLDREVHPFFQSAMDACWYQIRDPRNLPLTTMKTVANNNTLNKRKFILRSTTKYHICIMKSILFL